MAGAIMDKVWGLFGGVDQGADEEYDEDEAYEYGESENYEEEDRKFFGRKGKVVPLNAQGQSIKMVISKMILIKIQVMVNILMTWIMLKIFILVKRVMEQYHC